MNCPRCNRELAERRMGTGRAGVCPECGGAWVPFNSVEQVMPRIDELAPEPGTAGEAPAGEEKLKCPDCGGDLVTVKGQGAGAVATCTCLVCFGRWADGAELARLRTGGLGRLWRGLRRIFGGRPVAAAPPAEAAAGPPAEESQRTDSSPDENG